jgi:RNAse (barnase) inhibitor barstar
MAMPASASGEITLSDGTVISFGVILRPASLVAGYPHAVAVVVIPVQEIVDWTTFHEVFARLLRFPDYYGRNANAFIDCLGDLARGLDVPPLLSEGETLTIDLGDISRFRGRCPEQFAAIVDWIGWVNEQCLDEERPARLILAFG